MNAEPFAFQLNPRWMRTARSNTVLNGWPRDYHVRGYRTTLTIKPVVPGAESSP